MRNPFNYRFGLPSPFYDNETGFFSPASLFAFAEPGVWFDPSDVANLAWRRNLLTYSEQFDNAVWTKSNATVSANVTDPAGGTSADTITASANNAHVLQQIAVAAGQSMVPSVWIRRRTGTGAINMWNAAGATVNITSSVSSSWSRVTVPAATAGSGPFFFLQIATSGDAVDIWGAQLELGTSATDYQRISDVNTEVIERFPNATLYQDTAGTTPVTTPGQTVGLMLDKSKGLVLGAELVANGDFATDTGWTKGTGWTISGGAARFSAGADNADLVQSIGLPVIGKTYRITLSLSYTSGGELRVIYGGQFYGLPSVSGTYTMNFTAISASDANIRFRSLTGASVYSIDNISVRELAGNHATQATLASRPIYGIEPVGGRRNLLTWSEGFDDAIWTKDGTTITTNAIVAPDGTLTGDKLIEAATTAVHRTYQSVTVANSTPHTTSIYAKAGERNWISIAGTTNGRAWFNLSTGVVGTVNATLTASIQSVGDGWYRCSVTQTTFTTTGYLDVGVSSADNTYSYTGNGTSGVFLWGAQLELGSTSTAYQRVTTQYDVTEAGVASTSYLAFDGVDDGMVTGTITPGVDKVQVFAGVRKLSTSVGVIVELSASTDSNQGTFVLYNQSTAGWGINSRGNVGSTSAQVSTGYVSPITNVLTGIAEINNDVLSLRANGAVIGTSAGDQGIGNYGNYPLYIGRRGGSTLPLNGRIYSLITRFGANLDAGVITNTETWVAGKTGFYQPIITGVPTIGVS